MSMDILNSGIWLASGFSAGLFASFVIKKRNFHTNLKYFLQATQGKHGVKMVLVIRTDLGMGKGKLASQCAHAAICCYREAARKCPEILASWEMLGQPKVVCRSENKGDEIILSLAQQAKELGLVSCVIKDAGKTQIMEGSVTVVGIGPGDAELVNKLTGHLKLL